jgi:hypothetical protein
LLVPLKLYPFFSFLKAPFVQRYFWRGQANRRLRSRAACLLAPLSNKKPNEISKESTSEGEKINKEKESKNKKERWKAK